MIFVLNRKLNWTCKS